MTVDEKSLQTSGYFKQQQEEWSKVDFARVPAHIAIIMDGNGRWAKERGWQRVMGHENARTSVRESVRACGELGVKVLSLFAFSTENWTRPKQEVDFLFELFKRTLEGERQELADNNVRLSVCGDRARLPAWLDKSISAVEDALAKNTGLLLNLAVNYGGKQDVLRATQRLMASGKDPAKVTADDLTAQLYTAGLPDVDLLIRTSGEQRISNFFLWQAAYAELCFLPVLWPDFRREHLLGAVLEYQGRSRRFGAL